MASLDHGEACLAERTITGHEEAFVPERCAVCEGPFRLPKLLDCLHSVCEPCVKLCLSAGEDGAVVVCPVKDCSEQTCIPQGLISALPTNYLLLTSQRSTSGPCFCSECVDDEEAELHCAECSVFLCSFHVLSHRKSRSTAQHELQSIEEVRAQRHSRKQRHVTCPLHTQEMNFYCCSCDQLCCSQCTHGRGVHHAHSVAMAADVVDNVVSDLRERTKRTASSVPFRDSEKLMAAINARLDQLEDDARAASEKITAAIAEIKKALDVKEQRLLKKVDDLRSRREAELEEQLAKLQQAMSGVTMTTNMAERVLSNLPWLEQLHLCPILQKKLLEAGGLDEWCLQKSRVEKVSSPREKEITISKSSFCSKVAVLLTQIKDNSLGEYCVTNGLADSNRTTAELFPVVTHSSAKPAKFMCVSCRDSAGDLLHGTPGKVRLSVDLRSPTGEAVPAVILALAVDEKDNMTHCIMFEPLQAGSYPIVIMAQEEEISSAPPYLHVVNKSALQFTKFENCDISDAGTTLCASNLGRTFHISGAALGGVGITGGTLEWKLQLWGLSTSPSSIICVGVAPVNGLIRPGMGKRCLCWSWCSDGRFVSHDSDADEDLGVDEGDFTRWKDGDKLHCFFDYNERTLTIVNLASKTRSVVTNMSLNGKEMFAYVSLTTTKVRVKSLSWLSTEEAQS